MTPRRMIGLGSVFGFLSVGLGAMAAHGLQEHLTPKYLEIFETGAKYQMYHALALVLIGLVAQRAPSPKLDKAAWAVTAGVVLFSGSLYALALTGVGILGAVTPFGGVAFMAGWALLAWSQLSPKL